MKRLGKLISLLAVLGVLIAAFAIYSAFNKDEVNETPSTNTTVNVLSLDSEKIIGIEYEYLENKVSMQKKEDEWKWTDDESFPLDSYYPDYMTYGLAAITAVREIEGNLDNQASFGLDEPFISVKFKTSDGTEYAYSIGDYNSVARGYYFKVSTQDKVYLGGAEIVTPFTYSVLEMADKPSFPSFEPDDIVKLESVRNGTSMVITSDKTNADFYTSPYTYYIVDGNGKIKPASDVNTAALVEAVADLSYGSVLEYRPSSETLEKYGLGQNKLLVLNIDYQEEVKSDDNSDAMVTIKKDKSQTIYIGKYIDEESKTSYYIMIPDCDLLFELGESVAKALFDALDADFSSKLVSPVLENDALQFKIEYGSNKVHVYSIAEIDNNSKISGSFAKITGLVSEGIGNGTRGAVVFKVTFELEKDSLTLEVFEYDEKHYVANFDVWEDMLVAKDKIDSIITFLEG